MATRPPALSTSDAIPGSPFAAGPRIHEPEGSGAMGTPALR